MPVNVFGSISSSYDNKIDTSLFVQKPYLRTNYIESYESYIEEDINLKNQFRNKNLPDPISIREAASENYVDDMFNDPSIIKKNTTHIDLNDRNITNARFIKVNQLPQTDSHSTAKLYVDKAISDCVDKPTLLRLDPDEKSKQVSIILDSTLTSPKTINELPTKNYVDCKFNDPSIIKNTDHVDFNDKNFDNVRWIKVNIITTIEEHLTPNIYVDNAINDIISYVDNLHEINKNRREISSVFNDQDNEFDKNKLTNLDSVTVNRNPCSNNEVANKKYIDEELDKITIVRINQTLENYLKVSVGNDTYNLTKYDKIQITDTTIIKTGNNGGNLLQK